MKKLLLLAFLTSCATVTPEVKHIQATHELFCARESCPAFAEIHNYTLLESHAGSHACKCKLQSDNMPDPFEVEIPYKAPADAPVDSL